VSSQLLRVTLGAIVLLMLGVAAAACGDDDKETDVDQGTPGADAEGYYSDVDRIQNSLTERLDAISDQSEQAFGDPDSARNSLSAAKNAGETALEDLDALEAPSVAAAAHAGMVSASEEMVASVDGMIADLQGVEAGPDFDAFVNSIIQSDSAYTLAVESMRRACSDMQAAADNSRVDVVYQCPI